MENFRIEALEMNEVGPFKSFKIEFPKKVKPDAAEIHILTGANGTGKSTILEGFVAQFGNNSYQKKLWNIQTSQTIITYQVGNATYNYFKPSNVSSLDLQSNLYNLKIHSDDISADMALFVYSGYRKMETSVIDSIKEITNPPLSNALVFNYSTNPQLFLQWIANTKTRELIALGKNDKQKAALYRQSVSVIEQAISEIIESQIEFILEEEPLGVFLKMDNVKLDFDQLPDGLKSMVSWIGDLLMRMDRLKWVDGTPILERNFVVLLDEIEVHLHPAWQRKILPVVQKLFKNAQIFISTHSPFVVGSIDGAWVHKLEKIEGESVLTGPPILSEDANSYDYILGEIFGVKERFGVEIERKLSEFQTLKTAILQKNSHLEQKRLRELITELSGQSSEIDNILGMELRQLKRLTQQDFAEV